MKVKMYSVKDVKAKEFNFPFTFANDAAAVRGFGDAICHGDKNSLLASHPADFQLWSIGVFDTESGVVVSYGSDAVVLATGSDFGETENG